MNYEQTNTMHGLGLIFPSTRVKEGLERECQRLINIGLYVDNIGKEKANIEL